MIISLLTCLIRVANRMARNSASVYVCLHMKMAAARLVIMLRELILATQTEEDCRQWLRDRSLLAADDMPTMSHADGGACLHASVGQCDMTLSA